jgi:hypothetical protein
VDPAGKLGTITVEGFNSGGYLPELDSPEPGWVLLNFGCGNSCVANGQFNGGWSGASTINGTFVPSPINGTAGPSCSLSLHQG